MGAVLVPKLLKAGYHVKVLDLYIYGKHVLDSVKDSPNLEQIPGDIRNQSLLQHIMPGVDAVIHLACISNDPSFELDPTLGKSINYDAFPVLVDVARDSGVTKFVYASTSSVYGLKEETNVTENLPLRPLTDYSRYKAMCEEILDLKRTSGFFTLTLRPATVCGYSPRMRLDLIVNILTNHAFNNRKLQVFGGGQMRPNIHIEDVTDLYVMSLKWPVQAINGKVFNAGYQNHTVSKIAELVQNRVGKDVTIETLPSDDHRSYHISSEAIQRELGFAPKHTIEDAIDDIVSAFGKGWIPKSMADPRYYNIKVMQELGLE